jgi:hypothetical protein
MTRVASQVVGPLLVGLFLVGCGTQQSSQRAATISTADVGTCRGAFEHEAEAPATEWIPFADHLPTQLDAVFTAQAIEDLGERDIYTGEDGEGIDLPKLGRFTGISTLAGRVDEPVEVLMSPSAVDDATVTVAVGAELLVWLEPSRKTGGSRASPPSSPTETQRSSGTASQPGHPPSTATSNATAEVSPAQNSSPDSSLTPTDPKPPHSDPVTKRQPPQAQPTANNACTRWGDAGGWP